MTIEQFWAWFNSNEELISNLFHRKEWDGLDKLLTPVLRKLSNSNGVPQIGWELNRSKKTIYFSPRTIGTITFTEKLCSQKSEEIVEWRFEPYKPKRPDFGLKVHVSDDIGTDFEFDLENWLYRLGRLKDSGKIDVEIYVPNYQSDLRNLYREAALQIMFSLIGQKLFLQEIISWEAAPLLNSTKGNRFRVFEDHLNKVILNYNK